MPNSETKFQIKKASAMHLDQLHNLFDEYRDFYQMPPAPETSKKFLKQRLSQNDSIILIAFDDFHAAGFCQIYPSFSSVAMKPLWVLNDLFVNRSFRQQGVAQQLIEEVELRANNSHIFSIKLATAIDNHQAQKLYQKLGYQKNTNFDHFSKKL